jgi:hypothetical protein
MISSSDGKIEGSSDAILCHPLSLTLKILEEDCFRARDGLFKDGENGSMQQGKDGLASF